MSKGTQFTSSKNIIKLENSQVNFIRGINIIKEHKIKRYILQKLPTNCWINFINPTDSKRL